MIVSDGLTVYPLPQLSSSLELEDWLLSILTTSLYSLLGIYLSKKYAEFSINALLYWKETYQQINVVLRLNLGLARGSEHSLCREEGSSWNGSPELAEVDHLHTFSVQFPKVGKFLPAGPHSSRGQCHFPIIPFTSEPLPSVFKIGDQQKCPFHSQASECAQHQSSHRTL